MYELLGPGFFSYCLVKTIYWEWSKLKYSNAVTLMDKYLVRDEVGKWRVYCIKKICSLCSLWKILLLLVLSTSIVCRYETKKQARISGCVFWTLDSFSCLVSVRSVFQNSYGQVQWEVDKVKLLLFFCSLWIW